MSQTYFVITEIREWLFVSVIVAWFIIDVFKRRNDQ